MTAAANSKKLPVYTRHIELPLHLAPAYLAQPMQGVREQIDKSSMRYVDQLGGVLLSYTGLQLQHALGRIAGDAPEVHVRVSFDATFFAPKPGDVIEGIVSRIGHDHIALLVMEIFNGSVSLPAGWDPTQPSVKVDEPCTFVVREVRHTNGLISMHGELGDGAAKARSGATPRSAAASARGASRVAAGSGRGSGATPGSSAPATATPATGAASTPAPASAIAAATPAATDSSGGVKRKKTPEEKEAKRKRKAEKAAKKAAAAAAAAATQ